VLNRLVDLGNTVIVVEHNLDVIKTADWVIDLGPEAGDAGGTVVAAGTPEQVAGVKASHTGAVLAEVLAAGPHAERSRYDPAAALSIVASLEQEAVGQDAKMPWEVDGRGWHTRERVSHRGRPCRWEGHILNWIEERIHESGPFGDTCWNHRTVVEIPAQLKSRGWFFHAHTGLERYLRLVFRVGRNTFQAEELRRRLGIRSLNELPGLDVYGDEQRVHVANRRGPWQEVAVLAFRLDEIDTPPFRQFLKEAVASFQQNLRRMQTRLEDVMPWKVNGERWHLGDKGFPPGKQMRWDRGLLPRLLDLVREVETGLVVEWDNRLAINLRVPGVSRAWGSWRTKKAEGLECWFLGKKGQFNLSQVECFGVSPTIRSDRADGDVLQLLFQHADHVHPVELKALLTEHLRGFREAFGGR
jgi:excinuclease ABC subunit A